MRKFFWVFIILALLTGCEFFGDSHYTPSRSDVVDGHGKTTNLKNFLSFFKHVKDGKKDKIRIVRFTTEGDPILYDLSFNEKTLQMTIDNTRDRFGSGGVIANSCKSIDSKTTDGGTEYFLIGCSNANVDNMILGVPK